MPILKQTNQVQTYKKYNEMQSFKHYGTAGFTPEMVILKATLGMEGIGIYWSLIELLSNMDYEYQCCYAPLSFILNTEELTVKSVVEDFSLFYYDGVNFSPKECSNWEKEAEDGNW